MRDMGTFTGIKAYILLAYKYLEKEIYEYKTLLLFIVYILIVAVTSTSTGSIAAGKRSL